MKIEQYFSLPQKERPSLYSTEWLQHSERLKEEEIIYLLKKGTDKNEKEWDYVMDMLSDCYNLIPVVRKMLPLVDNNFTEEFTEEMFGLLITGTSYQEGYEMLEILTDLWDKNISKNLKCWLLESLSNAAESSCCDEAFDKLKEVADTEPDEEIRNYAKFLIDDLTSEPIVWI